MIKLSAVIAEYNPFHNGHQYNLQKIKQLSGCDYIAVIMSGNFTQRGDVAIMDKYTRATHAIKAGADIVIELPCAYATANAEIFALGGVKVFDKLNASTLCFGAENVSVYDFKKTAKLFLNEPKQLSLAIKNHLKSGYTLAKAKSLATCQLYGVQEEFISSPNNILGIEYTKAILKICPDKQILPILRQGAGYNDTTLKENFSSASAIRLAIKKRQEYFNNVPPFVAQDVPKNLPQEDNLILFSLLQKSLKELKNIPDCTEGLENRIYRLARENQTTNDLLESLLCKRYTKTRLQRILINSLLNIEQKLIKLAKKTTPYLKVLAIKKDKMYLLSELSKTSTLLTRKGDEKKLTKSQKILFEKDVFAGDIYSFITKTPQNPFEMKII